MVIREAIYAACQCCHIFLFSEQSRMLSNSTEVKLSDDVVIAADAPLCLRCYTAIMKKKIPKVSVSNNLVVDPVPPCLNILGPIEQRMISQIQTYMTIIVLPGGQYAEKCLTIHFLLDLNHYYEQLMALKDEHFVIVSHDINKQKTVHVVQAEKVSDLVKVRSALLWLKANNPLYSYWPDIDSTDCTIDTNMREDINYALTVGQQDSVISVDYAPPDMDVCDVIRKKVSLPIKFSQPTWISYLPHGEELAFPWLFPLGRYGLTEPRLQSLSVLQYFHQRF